MKRSVRRVLIGISMLIVLVTFYLKTNCIVFSEHERFDENLDRLQALDATLNQDVLKARFRLLEDYDGFPRKINELKRTVADLSAIPAFVSDAGREAIRQKGDALTQLFAQKEDLLERFKSQNAVLNNSLRYLPVAGTELVTLVSTDEQGRELESLLNELLRKVLVYSLQSSEDQTPEIQRSLGKLDEWRSRHGEFAQAGALASLAGHVNSILRRKPLVEALVQEIVSFPVSQATEKLLRAYDGEFSAALHSAEIYRVALYLLCAVLVVGIGSTILALDAANTHLESRVAERTGDLSRKNEELQASEEKFHQLAENITDAFWIRSADMQEVHYLSPGFERIWGRSVESLYANPHQWTDFILPEDRERVERAFAELAGDAPSLDVDYRIVRPDGEIRWVRVRGFQVRDAAAKLIRQTGIVTDITEGKRAEAQRQRLADLVEASPDFIGFADPKTTQAQYINKHSRRMCGIGEDEDIRKLKISDVHPAWMNKLFAEVILPTAVRDGSWEGEGAFLHRDGREIPISMVLMARKAANGEVDIFYTVSRDITERKRAEQATERTLQRLNDAQRIAQIGDWEWDMATQAITWSPQVFKIFGRDPRLGPPQDFEALGACYDAASWLVVQENVARAIESGEAQDYEHVIVRPDGGRVHGQAMAVPRKDESGRVVGLYGTVQDISARKQTEEALRVSEERLRAALSASSTGTFRWDIRLNELSWDDSLDALFGLSPGQTVRSLETFIATVHPDDRPGVIERCERCASEGADFDMEFRVVWPDGSLHWLDDRGKTFSDAAGQSLYMTGACVDITERKRAEEALRASETEFRVLAEALPQLVWITRADGWLIYCNQHWMDSTGLTLEESLGPKWINALHPEDQQRAGEAWQHATATVGVYSVEYRLVRRDGSYRWWLARGVPQQDASGKVLKWFGTCTDIHDMKLAELEISRAKGEIERLNADLEQRVVLRTEECFAATQEAERANRAKSEFLSRTSHELRTPMNAILGFGQLLEMEESLVGEPRESVAQILNAGRHLMTLIDEVLNISNAESGALTLTLEPVVVDELITETLSLIGSQERTLKVEVIRASPLGCGWKVLADPQRLKQVLLNLLSNATKYNRPGGTVTVEFAPVEESDPPAFRFSVRDTGPGISPEKLPRLFTPFDRLDAERTKTHVVGTGLGLALARRMIELMDGRIGVESVVGEGSTFWVEVPLAESPIAAIEQSAPALDPAWEFLNSRTLLYIEDNVSNLRLVTRILARRPAIQLRSAATGPLGLEIALEHQPDLIVLDLNLPGLNGDEVLVELRADPRTSAIPVVLLTADTRPETRERMLAAGACAFLAKPVDVRGILGVVDRFLQPQAGEMALDAATHESKNPMRVSAHRGGAR